MTKDYNNYNFDTFGIDYQAHNRELQKFKLNIEDLMAKYKGTEKEAKMKSIFIALDCCDSKPDGIINFYQTGTGFSWTVENRFLNNETLNSDNNYINIDAVRKQTQDDVQIEDFKDALISIMKAYDDYKLQIKKQANKEDKPDDIQHSDNIPQNVLEKAASTQGTIKQNTMDSNIEYELNYVNDESTEITEKYNQQGDIIQQIAKYSKPQPAALIFDDVIKLVTNYNEDGTILNQIEYNTSGGIANIRHQEDSIEEYIYGRNSIITTQNNTGLYGVIHTNKGLPNQTDFEILYDENKNVIDIVKKENECIINMPDNVKQNLITWLNKGLILGEDFEIETNCNQIAIRLLKDKNMPENLQKVIDELGLKGLAPDTDFSITIDEKGNYIIDYLTNEAREYNSDEKKVIYYTDGSTKTIEFVKPYTKEGANYYNYYDVQKTDFASNLLDVGDRVNISDTEYKQKIGDIEYNIKLEENQIVVTCNNNKFSIFTEGMHPNLAKMLFNSNPAALHRIAKQDIKIKFSAPPDGIGEGEYVSDENTIYIKPENSTIALLQQRIAHEVGHSFYTKEMPINNELENMFIQEKENCERNEKEVNALANEYLKKRMSPHEAQKFAISALGKDEGYCATHVYEFVAEVYCLLVTGHAKSEFTISRGFPKTFELAKQIILEKTNE